MWGVAACFGLTLATGCGDGKAPATGPGGTSAAASADKPRILFITNSNADFWSAVEKGMKDGGAEFGCQVEMRRNNEKTQGQVEKLKEAIGLSDVAGVAVSAIEADAPGVIDAMRELQQAGKVVITIDSDVATSAADARSAYIGTNNGKAGQTAGRAAAALRPDGGKVAVFVGTSSAANAREREAGFFEGAGSKFVRVETFEDGGDHSKAGSNVQSAISKIPDVGVLLGLWSYNAPAIAGEVRKSPEVRKSASVVTFDLDEAAVTDLSDGMIDASVVQNPYDMGYQGVRALKALIKKDAKATKEVLTGADGKTRETGVRVVVPKADSPVLKLNKPKGDDVITVDEMKTWLSSKGLKSS